MFQSTKHPHARMNKYGVVFVPNGHPDGADFYSSAFEWVPRRNGTLPLQDAIEAEARAAGWTMKYLKNGEVLWTRPRKFHHTARI